MICGRTSIYHSIGHHGSLTQEEPVPFYAAPRRCCSRPLLCTPWHDGGWQHGSRQVIDPPLLSTVHLYKIAPNFFLTSLICIDMHVCNSSLPDACAQLQALTRRSRPTAGTAAATATAATTAIATVTTAAAAASGKTSRGRRPPPPTLGSSRQGQHRGLK